MPLLFCYLLCYFFLFLFYSILFHSDVNSLHGESFVGSWLQSVTGRCIQNLGRGKISGSTNTLWVILLKGQFTLKLKIIYEVLFIHPSIYWCFFFFFFCCLSTTNQVWSSPIIFERRQTSAYQIPPKFCNTQQKYIDRKIAPQVHED